MDPERLQKQHTEHSILQSYLLIPSPLSTVLPFQTFSILLSASNRSSTSSTTFKTSAHLKPLYRSLQNQRDLSIAEVNDNITRECRRSQTLEARLARSIASEGLGSIPSKHNSKVNGPDQSRKGGLLKRDDLKRKQPANSTNETADENITRKRQSQSTEAEHAANGETEEGSSHSPRRSRSQSSPTPQPRRETKSTSLNPTTSKLPNISSHTEIQIDTAIHGQHGSVPAPTSTTQHTTSSLLHAMSQSLSDLEAEILELDEQTNSSLSEIKERIGGLSDLRYGRFGGRAGRKSVVGESVEGEEEGIEVKIVKELRELERVCGLRSSTSNSMTHVEGDG